MQGLIRGRNGARPQTHLSHPPGSELGVASRSQPSPLTQHGGVQGHGSMQELSRPPSSAWLHLGQQRWETMRSAPHRTHHWTVHAFNCQKWRWMMQMRTRVRRGGRRRQDWALSGRGSGCRMRSHASLAGSCTETPGCASTFQGFLMCRAGSTAIHTPWTAYP